MKTRFAVVRPGGRSSRAGMLPSQRAQAEDGFTCKHCGYFVSSAAGLCGVGNRNHCPYCLWSRHLDLYRAGDRLCACKAPMRPVGLVQKRTRKKYSQTGELMLAHACSGCAGVSINRLAADDDPQTLMHVFVRSLQLDPIIRTEFAAAQIELLGAGDWELVRGQLLGWEKIRWDGEEISDD
jgi:hypothetical protein